LNEFAQNKAGEREEKLPMNARAASVTFLLVLTGFVVFAFLPKTAEIFYGWIPFHAFHYPVQ